FTPVVLQDALSLEYKNYKIGDRLMLRISVLTEWDARRPASEELEGDFGARLSQDDVPGSLAHSHTHGCRAVLLAIGEIDSAPIEYQGQVCLRSSLQAHGSFLNRVRGVLIEVCQQGYAHGAVCGVQHGARQADEQLVAGQLLILADNFPFVIRPRAPQHASLFTDAGASVSCLRLIGRRLGH